MSVAPPEFRPLPGLQNPHAMTLTSRLWPRPGLLGAIPVEPRLFDVAPEARVLGHCHWQRDVVSGPTLVLVHGLEGSSDSHYMRGLAAKAWRRGFNVVRLNQRTCGGTEHLSATLYHSGLSGDVLAVIRDLTQRDAHREIWAVGYSMGGNLVLRAAAEAGSSLPALKGVLAVCPTIDPAACVAALERPRNWLYHWHFMRRLKRRLVRMDRLRPGRWDLRKLDRVRTLHEFDELYTAPDGGFRNAEDYYEHAAARRVLDQIRVPTALIVAQDDPVVPYQTFEQPAITRLPAVTLWATRFGGHCGFIQSPRLGEDRYWAENRLVELVSGQVSLRDAPALVAGATGRAAGTVT